MKTKSAFSFLVLFFALTALTKCARSQDGQKGVWMIVEVIHGDTFPVKYMPPVNIVAERTFRTKSEKKRFKRLQYNVKKMYPYAKLAGELLEKYESEIANAETERERKRFYKKIEEELKAEFEDDVRDMSTTQGRILIKLIDRETGNTSYHIVQEFRGNISAFFWQSLSRMFGQDLKSRYDPNGEDKEIESIVQLIEAGVI